jgi:hypothetical protein
MSNEADFYRYFPLEPNLDEYIDPVLLDFHCKSCKHGLREARAARKHKAQTFKRRIFLNSYVGEPENSAPNYLHYFRQKRELEYEKLIGGLLVGFDY